MINKQCIICDNVFTSKNNKRGREKKTCSVKCARKLGAMNNKITKFCIICGGETVTAKSNQLPRCEKCVLDKKKYTYKCEVCDKQFYTNKHKTRFCSRECVNEHNNKNIVDLKCFYCGNNFKRPSFTVTNPDRVFCSKSCRNNQYSLDNPTRYGGTWTRRRKEIMSRDNHRCLSCNKSSNLQVHHFVKLRLFKNPNDAHDDENVGTFCYDCHRLVEEKEYKSLSHFLKDIV